MSELQVIESALHRAARRQRWSAALRGMWLGLLIGSILCLIAAIGFHVLPWPNWTRMLVAVLPLPCLLIGLIIGGWRRPSLPSVARQVDRRQNLQERLSTALEVSREAAGGRWRDLVMADAAEHAKDLDKRKMEPFLLPRKPLRWALIALALAAGLGFIPEFRSKAYLQKKADRQNIQEVGRQLADLTKRSLEKRPPALETTQKSMEAVNELGEKLAKQSLTRSDALKDLASVSDKLKDQLKELGKDPALQKVEQAARSSNNGDSQNPSGMQKQMEAMQKQLGSPTGNPEAMDKLKKDLAKLEEAAKGLSDKNPPGGDSDKAKLSQSLSALSRQAQDMGLQLPQLDEAIQALAANQTDLVLKDLQEATTDLEKMRDMAKSLQQMQQQMEKMGKDLAEQLKNGQPEAAQSTLQKMIDQLKSSSLSKEQMQKMMEEVAKAVKPADNYGKVAEHLQAASKSMKAGDKAGAGKSLAEASKELEKLMQQMGDAQALMASLDNLEKASKCVGSCQGWGKCNKPGMSMKGGKPGSGVGTWGDDTAQWDGQQTDRWDNSGTHRPDADARGQSERSSDLNEALTPTKVKGQFSPGGQMPSITLKGVSIKGQSKVQYEEASAAAQSDAQSALSQEKVPRAYQSSVKDYFDDIKK
jgi:hypothetical protein